MNATPVLVINTNGTYSIIHVQENESLPKNAVNGFLSSKSKYLSKNTRTDNE